ncbi:MAG: DNA-3-methyladenine glycosylase 2 family protein, partial [Candidatus Thermoplasmatota archaeon]|nr:DNA-3-methyladenine glycosylase 2 family protein [Candidatus Thermoplasmatota archaeon]
MEKGEPSWWNDAIEHFQNDDIMAECIETYGKDGLKGRGDLFYTIVRSIIGQQISVIAAESIWNRFET